MLGLLKGISPIRTQHTLLSPKHRTKVGKTLLTLLGFKLTIGLSKSLSITGVNFLSGEVLTSTKLISLLSSLLIGKRRLKVGGLIHLLHVLGVRDVELTSLHTSSLISQTSLQHGLLIGALSLKAGSHVKLTSLKGHCRIGLLTGDIRLKHSRGKLLTHLLSAEKLLVNLLSSRNVLHTALAGKTSPSQGFTRDTSRAF